MKCTLENKLSAVFGLAYVIPGILFSALPAFAQTNETVQPASELKKLSLEELFEMEATMVSKKPEKLSETAAAIHVVTDEDVRHSCALSIPEVKPRSTKRQHSISLCLEEVNP